MEMTGQTLDPNGTLTLTFTDLPTFVCLPSEVSEYLTLPADPPRDTADAAQWVLDRINAWTTSEMTMGQDLDITVNTHGVITDVTWYGG